MAGLDKSTMFPEGIIRLHDGTIDFDAGVNRAMLVKSSFAATTLTDTNRDAFDFVNDIPSADRSSGTFKVFGTNDIVKDAANNNVKFADGTVSITFPTVASGNSCRGIVVFRSDTGGEAASPLMCYAHFTGNVTADGGTVTVTLAADGIFRQSYD